MIRLERRACALITGEPSNATGLGRESGVQGTGGGAVSGVPEHGVGVVGEPVLLVGAEGDGGHRTTRGWQCPVLATPMPVVKSRYSLPSVP